MIFTDLRGGTLAHRLHNLALMPCIHCGLPTRGEANHGTMEECIEALVAETMRLRKAISETPGTGDIASAIASVRSETKDFAAS